MAILRTQKNKDYSVISNIVLRDKRLSWRARGIAAYLLTQPDDWNINSEHLWKSSTEGRDAVRSALKELETTGYLFRQKHQDEKGRFITELILNEIPTPDFQSSVVQSPVDQALLLSTKEEVLLLKELDASHPSTAGNLELFPLKEKATAPTKATAKAEPTTTTATPPSLTSAPPPLTEQQEMFGAICLAVGWDDKTLTKASRGQVAQTLGILRKAGYSSRDVDRWHKEVWLRDWRGAKGEWPTIKQLREEIGKVSKSEPQQALVIEGDW